MISSFKASFVSRPRAKKDPFAPSTRLPGLNGSSTVPYGEVLVTVPNFDVGEYCPFVMP